MNTMYHVGLSVRGALGWPKRELNGILIDKATNIKLTADQVRNKLLDALQQGHEVLPFESDACDNWNPKTGCGGHRESE